MCPPRTRILNYASGDSKTLYPAVNRQVFNTEIRGKRWNWCEITDADLPATGIRPIDLPKLRDAMWFCSMVQSIQLQTVANIAAIIEATR